MQRRPSLHTFANCYVCTGTSKHMRYCDVKLTYLSKKECPHGGCMGGDRTKKDGTELQWVTTQLWSGGNSE